MNKLYPFSKLMDLKMAEGVPFAEHLNEFNRIIETFSLVKVEFNEEATSILLLTSLPDSLGIYESSVTFLFRYKKIENFQIL